MKKQTRVAAIIVKDGKLLLVKGPDKYKEYWTPGGRIEEGESELACLKRELQEELNVDLESADFFKEYETPSVYFNNTLMVQKIYSAKISGEPRPRAEIQAYVWMSRDDFKNNTYPLITDTQNRIIPDLIQKGLF